MTVECWWALWHSISMKSITRCTNRLQKPYFLDPKPLESKGFIWVVLASCCFLSLLMKCIITTAETRTVKGYVMHFMDEWQHLMFTRNVFLFIFFLFLLLLHLFETETCLFNHWISLISNWIQCFKVSVDHVLLCKFALPVILSALNIFHLAFLFMRF